MGCHLALVSHQPAGGRSPQEAAALAGGVSVGHMHGCRSYLRLPTQQTSLSDLLTELEDVSHTVAVPALLQDREVRLSVRLAVTHLLSAPGVAAGLLLLPPGQTGHPAQQPRGQTCWAGLVAGLAGLSLLLTVVLLLPLVLPGVALGRVGALSAPGRI